MSDKNKVVFTAKAQFLISEIASVNICPPFITFTNEEQQAMPPSVNVRSKDRFLALQLGLDGENLLNALYLAGWYNEDQYQQVMQAWKQEEMKYHVMEEDIRRRQKKSAQPIGEKE